MHIKKILFVYFIFLSAQSYSESIVLEKLMFKSLIIVAKDSMPERAKSILLSDDRFWFLDFEGFNSSLGYMLSVHIDKTFPRVLNERDICKLKKSFIKLSEKYYNQIETIPEVDRGSMELSMKIIQNYFLMMDVSCSNSIKGGGDK